MEKLAAQTIVQKRAALETYQDVLKRNQGNENMAEEDIEYAQSQIDKLTKLINEQVSLWGDWQAIDNFLTRNDPKHSMFGPWPQA